MEFLCTKLNLTYKKSHLVASVAHTEEKGKKYYTYLSINTLHA